MNKLIVLLLLAGTANAETFNCQAGTIWFPDGEIAVTATGNDDATGKIHAAGVTYEAWYHIEGFTRRWDFVLNENEKYNYAFEIQVDGSALYFDFTTLDSGEASASALQLFVCKKA